MYKGPMLSDKEIKAHHRAHKSGRWIQPRTGGEFSKPRILTDDEAIEFINKWVELPPEVA